MCGTPKVVKQDWCLACGHHFRLNIKVEADPWDMLTAQPDAVAAPEPPPLENRGIVNNIATAWRLIHDMPAWGWKLLGGAAIFPVLMTILRFSLTEFPGVMSVISWCVLIGGAIACGGAYLLSYAWAIPRQDGLGMFDLVTRPWAIWWPTLRDLPDSFTRVAAGLWGLAAFASALLLGGFVLRIDWGEDVARTALTRAIIEQERLAKQLAAAPPAEKTKSKKPQDPRKFTTDCVLLGYTPSVGNDFESLVLGMVVEGKLRFVGQIWADIPDDDRASLYERMQQAQRSEPFVPCNVGRAIWLEPKLAVRVKYEQLSSGKKLINPLFVKVLAGL